ncbi:MAG: DNA polymerase III subunit gamma/tau [Bacteroidales bacterium]|nr:DNA polymerase III subunit gamma/tau [Bacteroidales bacterium]
MSDYIVSARKYRPDSFETLIGQDTIARTLSNSIRRGQLAHAYLFCGPRGVGKTTTARIFAKMINCANPGPEMEPCGECESCVSFQEGRSYCIHELDAASNNSVEDIKTLMEQVQVPPQVGKYSVYIIDEVHMLSQAAFNAFLKTLEEPPAHAIFILATTEKHKILPTILSRCQTYDFNRISIPDMVRNLQGIAEKEGVKIDDKSLHVIASKADGAMRDALTIFDQTVAFCGKDVKYEDVIRNLNVLDYEFSFSLVDNFLAGDYASAFLTFDKILAKGFNALHFVGSLSTHLRNLVVAKTGGIEPLLELPDSLKAEYAAQAAKCSNQFLFEALGITTQCETGYKAAVNPRLHIEFALMKLSYLMGKPGDKPVVAPTPRAEMPGQAGHDEKAAGHDEKAAGHDEKAAGHDVKTDEKPAEAPKPAPAPAAAPAAAPAPRRRAAKTGSALSMSALMEEKPKEVAQEAEAQDSVALPEDEVLKLKWKELAGQYGSKPRLASMLSSGKVEVKAENGIKVVEFFVTNESQKQWIEEKMLRELEYKLRDLVSCHKVNVIVSVTPMEEIEKVPYMPEEKAKDLMDKEPAVREFIAAMGLDTK